MHQKSLVLIIILTLIAIGVVFAYFFLPFSGGKKNIMVTEEKSANESPFAIDSINTASLIQKSALTEEALPFKARRPIPTNQWYSSLFFQKNGYPLYSFPWAVRFTDEGFQAGYPAIVSSPSIVTGGMSPDITFTSGEKHDGIEVDTWDDLSILASAKRSDSQAFSLRIVRGSPFLWTTLYPGEKYTLSVQGEIQESSAGRFLIRNGEKSLAVYMNPNEVEYGVASPQTLTLSSKERTASLALSVLGAPQDIDRYAPFAADPVERTSAAYNLSESGHSVRYELETVSGQPTLFGLLPHHQTGNLTGEHADFGELKTVRGTQRVVEGETFEFSYPKLTGSYRFDLASLSPEEKNTLRQTLLADVKRLQFPDPDTYFSGKRLVAAAHLLSLARDLGEEEAAQEVAEKLKDQFTVWRDGTVGHRTDGHYFAYDPVIHGVVGYQSSFGSELFNDHHFHYGYFILAAAILGEYDPEFVNEYAPFINLLVMDIANLDRTNNDYPYLRSYDHYEGHSWAAGQALFEDGNNEESTSEAIQSWYGIARWAKLIGSPQLEVIGQALYSEESRAALSYWFHPSWPESPSFENYTAPLVSLLWGGKMEYATWFSDTPEAKLGIELLPLGPQSHYLLRDPEGLRKDLTTVSMAPGALFRDVHLMALSMIDRAQAKSLLASIDDQAIDTWNTRSYLTAWVLSGKYDDQKDVFSE